MNVEILKPYIAPILAPIVGLFVTWFAAKTGIIYSEEVRAKIVEGVTTLVIIGIVFVTTGAAKVAIGKKFNPSNANTTELASKGATENNHIRAMKRK